MPKKREQKDKTQNKLFYALFGLVAFVVIASTVFNVSANNPPYDVSWDIGNFYSDVYNLSELTLYWSGETGTATNLQVSGGLNNGSLETTYDTPDEYNVFVHARNSIGEQVSAEVSCSANVGCLCPSGFICVDNTCVPELSSTCAAYPTAQSQLPQLFFGPGEEVYWKATVNGGNDPYTYSWTNAADGETTQTVGPYSVGPGEDYEYDNGPIYTAEVAVRDEDFDLVNSSCSISIKECNNDNDCPGEEICRLDDFTCGPPKPIFVENLSINPGVVNTGEQCAISWEVDNAFVCEVYKNGQLFDANAPTTTPSGYNIDPGSYNLHCENAIGESIDAGPATCLLNPEIKES